MTEHSGLELRVYDKSRRPRNWNELLAPDQCAVFLSRIDAVTPLAKDGTRAVHSTFFLFDRLEDARAFCEAEVEQYPYMSCKIYDSAGMARPPLLTIVHPDPREKDELSASSVRKRAMLAGVLFLAALPLFWWDWHAGSTLILPTVLGVNFIAIGLRLLYWNFARRERLSEEDRRIAAHLALEKKMSRVAPPEPG